MSIGIVLRSHDRFTASALARVVMLVLAVCLFAGSAAATDVSPLEAEVSSGTAVEVPDSLRELLQRGGTPTAADRILGSRFGVAAVDALSEGKSAVMTALRGEDVVLVPMTELAGKTKPVPEDLLRVASYLA